MAFEKGSLGANQKVKDYTDGFEGRVAKAFDDVGYETGGDNYKPNESIGSGNYRIMQRVNFSRKFKTSPTVMINSHTQDPQVVYATATGVDQNGFTMVYIRPNQNPGFVSWFAIERDQ